MGTLEADIAGDDWAFMLTHSNIDEFAPDGLLGATELEVEVRLE